MHHSSVLLHLTSIVASVVSQINHSNATPCTRRLTRAFLYDTDWAILQIVLVFLLVGYILFPLAFDLTFDTDSGGRLCL